MRPQRDIGPPPRRARGAKSRESGRSNNRILTQVEYRAGRRCGMWFTDLFLSGVSTANAVMVIAVVSMLGLALGEVKFGPVHLGIAGPLFVGIALGHFGFKMDPGLLAYARDFGLILFVYAIGIRVGPGFFSAFKKDGALLNMFAAMIVVSGALIAVAIHFTVGLPL